MTVYEIAKLAGVSVATVSRVINGKHDVSEETRVKILNIMSDHRFQPKVSVVRGRAVGVFVPLGGERKISSPYFARTLSGIGDRLFERDYRLTIVSTYKIPKRQQEFIQFCRDNRIEGGIFALSNLEDTYINEIAEKFPVVVIGNRLESKKVTYINCDAFKGSKAAVNYLIQLGHKDIMFMYEGTRSYNINNRIRGYKEALADNNLKVEDMFIFGYDYISDSDLYLHIKNLIDNYRVPTAMVVSNDTQALRIMNILSNNGIKVPEQISVIGFDDLSFSMYTNPPLTTVKQPIYEEGIKAVDEIINMLELEESYQYKDIFFEPELTYRSSVRALK